MLTVLWKFAQHALFLTSLALAYITVISFSFSTEAVSIERQEQDYIRGISRHISSLYGILQTDTSRLAVQDKIIGIIDSYNISLADSLKKAIAFEIQEMSLKYDNLDVDLICATITHETARTWRPEIESPAGALGLMQLMPLTARYLSDREGIKWTSTKNILHNPVYNIRLGCRYLSALIKLYSLDGGLAAYNGGESRAAKWLASGRDDEVLFEETRGYIPAVLRLYDIFRN